MEKATARARSDAEVLARGMGVKLGPLVYVTDQISEQRNASGYAMANFSAEVMVDQQRLAAPLAIEPHKVSKTASVYAVFSIE